MPDDAPWTDPLVVPDDISALQADVEAYHRELRRAARRRRWGPLASPVLWRRLALPLVVAGGGLALATLVTAVMTFDGTRTQAGPVRPGPIATAPPAGVGQVQGLLPHIRVRDDSGALRSVRSLRPAVFALVPQHCRCTDLLVDLAAQADEVSASLVVVAPAATDAEVATLVGQVHRGRVVPVWDARGVLARTYAATGVTVLIVAPDATVGYVDHDVTASTRLEGPLLEIVEPPVVVRGGRS